MGVAAETLRDGDDAVVRSTLGDAFEGAPGRAHGGMVAALFDEAMGFVLSIACTPAFTGRLTVTYRAPVPIGVPLEFRARLTGRDGRKLSDGRRGPPRRHPPGRGRGPVRGRRSRAGSPPVTAETAHVLTRMGSAPNDRPTADLR